MSYNEEKLNIAEAIVQFAELGFMARVREIAEALSICPKDDVKVIAEQLNLAIEALEEANRDVLYYKVKVKAEKEKEQ
jgi:NACalpha-BTF3-like transcription factor